MKKDEIMKLALESGFAKILDEHASEYRDFTFELSQDQYPELGRFVNLIAAVERSFNRECANKTCIPMRLSSAGPVATVGLNRQRRSTVSRCRRSYRFRFHRIGQIVHGLRNIIFQHIAIFMFSFF